MGLNSKISFIPNLVKMASISS